MHEIALWAGERGFEYALVRGFGPIIFLWFPLRWGPENRASFGQSDQDCQLTGPSFPHIALQFAWFLDSPNDEPLLVMHYVLIGFRLYRCCFWTRTLKMEPILYDVCHILKHVFPQGCKRPEFPRRLNQRTLVYHILNSSCGRTFFPSVCLRKTENRLVLGTSGNSVCFESSIMKHGCWVTLNWACIIGKLSDAWFLLRWQIFSIIWRKLIEFDLFQLFRQIFGALYREEFLEKGFVWHGIGK